MIQELLGLEKMAKEVLEGIPADIYYTMQGRELTIDLRPKCFNLWHGHSLFVRLVDERKIEAETDIVTDAESVDKFQETLKKYGLFDFQTHIHSAPKYTEQKDEIHLHGRGYVRLTQVKGLMELMRWLA